MFDNTSFGNCTIDPAFLASVAGIRIENGYLATVTVARDFQVTGQTTIEADTKIDPGKTLLVHNLVFQGADLSGGGTLRLGAPVGPQGGATEAAVTINDSDVFVEEQAQLTVGGNLTIDDGELINHGILKWTGGDIDVKNAGGVLENHGQWRLLGDDKIFGTNGGEIRNYGVISKEFGQAGQSTAFNGALENFGLVDVAAGSLAFTEGSPRVGVINVAANAKVEFLGIGPTYTFAGGSGITGAGQVKASGFFDWVIEQDAHVTVTASLDWDTAAMKGAGSLLVSGSFTWRGGGIDHLASLELAGTNLITGDDVKHFVQSGLAFSGPTVWEGAGNLQFEGGIINNYKTFEVKTDAEMDVPQLAAPTLFVNSANAYTRGTFTKTQGDNGNVIKLEFENRGGDLKLNGNKLTFALDVRQTNSASTVDLGGGTIAFAAGKKLVIAEGTLVGFGTVDGKFVLESVLDFGTALGTLVVTGDMITNSGAVIKMKLGGTAAGQFDQVDCRGAAQIGARLEVSAVNLFAPALNDSFQVIKATGTLTSTISDVLLPALSDTSWTWVMEENAHDVTLSVTEN